LTANAERTPSPSHARTATPIVVCADDYAFTPGVSRGIRELIAARRISATSVMTGSEFWPSEAAALKAVAGDADIGLHVTLTDQKPLGEMRTFAPEGRFPPLSAVFRAGLLGRLPLSEIEAEIERQVEAFMTHYGAPPAHVDGHHHVHQLPGVRDIVVRIAAGVGGGRTWVRSCAEARSSILRRGVGIAKAVVISALGPPVAVGIAIVEIGDAMIERAFHHAHAVIIRIVPPPVHPDEPAAQRDGGETDISVTQLTMEHASFLR
jgi:predicted glycoside hydrolase/deacetylase ChbG (UPF0249 family)